MGWMTAEELEEATLLHYSRVLWRSQRTRRRLLHMWEHPIHPDRKRFEDNRAVILEYLKATIRRGTWIHYLAPVGR